MELKVTTIGLLLAALLLLHRDDSKEEDPLSVLVAVAV